MYLCILGITSMRFLLVCLLLCYQNCDCIFYHMLYFIMLSQKWLIKDDQSINHHSLRLNSGSRTTSRTRIYAFFNNYSSCQIPLMTTSHKVNQFSELILRDKLSVFLCMCMCFDLYAAKLFACYFTDIMFSSYFVKSGWHAQFSVSWKGSKEEHCCLACQYFHVAVM